MTPRGPEPPRGLLVTMQGQIESITKMVLDAREKLIELDSAVTEVEAAVENIRKTPGDADQIATRGFVDDGLARLSRALRGELLPVDAKPGDRLITMNHLAEAMKTIRVELRKVVDGDTQAGYYGGRPVPTPAAMWQGMRAAVATITEGLGKKAKRRLRKALPSWFRNTEDRAHGLLHEIEAVVDAG